MKIQEKSAEASGIKFFIEEDGKEVARAFLYIMHNNLHKEPFGFMEDVFIHPALVTRYKLTDGLQFTGKAIKSYNQEKKQWGWKLL